MQVGNYVLERLLGEGGMGQVWLAHHVHLGTPAVVKSLHPQYAQYEQLRQRFLTEARLLAQLSHPAIVRLYDFTIQDGTPYLIMEYVQGQSLDDLLKAHRALSLETTIRILVPILDALAYLHQHKVIHRDIKPSNILVLPDGTGKLIDFGIAKALDENLKLTQTGTQVGTALYMAPEQIKGEPVSPRTDLYAMGLVVYECLIGRFPWEWEGLTAFQIYQKLLTEPPPIPPGTPEAIQSFLAQALAKAPEERFPSAEAMKEALIALGSPHITPASPRPAPKSTPTRPPTPAPAQTKAPTASPTPVTAPPKKRKNIWLTALLTIIGIALLIRLTALALNSSSRYAEDEPYEEAQPPAQPEQVSVSTPLSEPLQPTDYSSEVYPALATYLANYREPNLSTLRWGEIPRGALYEKSGVLTVPVEMSFSHEDVETREYEEACYLSGISIGPPRGTRHVTEYYDVIYECTQSGIARIYYSLSENGVDFSVILPDRSPSTANCNKIKEIYSHKTEGECE